MSESEATRFFNQLESDTALQEEIGRFPAIPEKIYSVIVARGFDCTVDELREAFVEYAAQHLDENQLGNLSAGISKDEKIVAIACPSLLAGGVAVGVAASAAAAF